MDTVGNIDIAGNIQKNNSIKNELNSCDCKKDINKLVEKLSLFNKMYNLVRVVDPVKKRVYECKEDNFCELDSYCYQFWKQDKICDNCISMRAYRDNDTFIKIEYVKEKVFIVTAVPVNLGDKIVIVELLKDVTSSMVVGDDVVQGSNEIYSIINNLNQIAIKDSLTELFNRRYINERLPVDILNSVIMNKPISIIMADLDHFKSVNDKYGHVNGDMVLKAFAETLTGSVRKGKDWVARYGGEEFLICLPETDTNTAAEIAERMRNSIQNKTFIYEGKRFRITASFGICTFSGNACITIEDFIESADKKLYDAKKEGRNRVKF